MLNSAAWEYAALFFLSGKNAASKRVTDTPQSVPYC